MLNTPFMGFNKIGNNHFDFVIDLDKHLSKMNANPRMPTIIRRYKLCLAVGGLTPTAAMKLLDHLVCHCPFELVLTFCGLA